MNPKITLAPRVAVTLEAIRKAVEDVEFSGFGFCTQDETGIYIYDFVLLDVGRFAYTEIPASEIVPLMDREDAANMKVWVHRHPLGDGQPGWHNWSGTDENTIQTCPLGGIPELVKWSASIVFTPCGWVGRFDNHLTKETIHVPVNPQIDWSQVRKAEGKYVQYVNAFLEEDDGDDDEYIMDADEIEEYLDDDETDEGYTQQDFLLSQMHTTALRSARVRIR